MKFSFIVQKSCPYNCWGLQLYGHFVRYSKNCPYTWRGLQFEIRLWRGSENCQYTCRDLQFEVWLQKLSIQLQRSAVWATHPMSQFFSTLKTVESIHLQRSAVLFKTWKYCRYSENCPSTCRRLQLEGLSIHLHLQSSSVWTIGRGIFNTMNIHQSCFKYFDFYMRLIYIPSIDS